MTNDEQGLPVDFLTKLKQNVSNRRYEEIIHAFSLKKPTTFRVNTLKSENQALITSLTDLGFEVIEASQIEYAFILKNKSLRELMETPPYKNGELYVQSLSSMLPPVILNPKPGDRVLDIAAAPGSKTTQMAALMKNRGEIVANDTSLKRIYRLKANLTLQGATVAHVSRDDGRSIWKRYSEYFDKALVDAPCSMEGRFNSNDPKSYQDWSLKKVKELSRLQHWLLQSAISATKPGGVIVYSTCTLNTEENEEVIGWILEKERGKIALEETKRIDPSALMEGFFIAKIRKVKSTV